MFKVKHILIFLIIFAALVALFVWESDVDKILAQLNDLNDAISKTGKEGKQALLYKAAAINRVVTNDCEIWVDDSRIGTLQGKEAILAHFRALWPQVEPQQAVFEEVRIQVQPGGRLASATLKAYLLELREEQPRRSEDFDVSLDWLKNSEGEWQLEYVRAVPKPAASAVP